MYGHTVCSVSKSYGYFTPDSDGDYNIVRLYCFVRRRYLDHFSDAVAQTCDNVFTIDENCIQAQFCG